MIQSIQKLIKIGSSGGVTIPAKDLKRSNTSIGDEIEFFWRPANQKSTDAEVVRTAKQILSKYKQDFKNLAKR